MPGFKDRITVMLRSNTAGYKLKPFVIWHSENPKTFKHISKHTLPVYYRSSKKSRMTQLLFKDALLNCYASKMAKYYLENNIPYKTLLMSIMLLDILFLLVIFIPISKWCFSLKTLPL